MARSRSNSTARSEALEEPMPLETRSRRRVGGAARRLGAARPDGRMRAEGLEPPRLAPPAPKAGVSTSSTTPARGGPAQSAPWRRIVWSPPGMDGDEPVIEHPNRRKLASKVTMVLVVLLLLVSAALVLVVTIGGWDELQGAKALQIAYVAVYVIMAFLVARWNRGVLPVAAALAIVLLIFAAIAGPQWFERDKEGFADPALAPSLLGLVTLLLVPVQALLIVTAMQGFRQAWNVEVERRRDENARGSRAVPQPS